MSASHSRSSSHALSRSASSAQPLARPSAPAPVFDSSPPRPQPDRALPPPASRKRRSDHGGLPDEAKRRRQAGGFLATDELLKPSIVVRAHPPNPLSKPCMLLPLMLLPREHLPLSCLDLSAPSGELPSGRRFQSHIRIMELEGRLGSNIVLLARSPASNSSTDGFSSASSIFAIERDDAGLYVLCKLGSWVDIRQLGELATAVCRQRMPASAEAAAAAAAAAAANVLEPALITPQVHKEQRRRRLAIAELQSVVKLRRAASQLVAEPGRTTTEPAEPAATDALPSPQEDGHNGVLAGDKAAADQPSLPPSAQAAHVTSAPLPTPPASDATRASPAVPVHPALAADPMDPPTADGIFQNIRNQYFEALYHSMGSLAYFAKGPLSRARAAFHLDCDANLEMDDLINFLKSLVLATTTIDKKYRETVPEIVNRLRTLGGIGDDLSDHAEPMRKSKKPKKPRFGSNGLYSDEERHVRKWWFANKPEPREDEVFPRPEEVRYTISCLRTRETQLQIILILEILALESMRPPASEAGESQLPGMAPEVPAVATAAKKDLPKKRSKHNFPRLIDVHADRLCIWQSTTSDEVKALAESQIRGGAHALPSAHSDPLRDFCVDIIVPFFQPRLPLICDSLNRKMGGPVIAPPSRSKTAHATDPPSNAKSKTKAQERYSLSSKLHPKAAKSGAAAATPGNSARSLERVLSNERLRRSVSRGPNDAIAQMRSATAAPIPGLKREMSEPVSSLAAIPRRASSTSLKERPANVLARSTSDMVVGSGSGNGNSQSNSVANKIDDVRARRKALVEAELQEAISALKKPNRELAGKAAVEAAERRLFKTSNNSRKIKKPSRPPPTDNPVQVKATPVNNRFRDVFVTTATESQENGGSGEFDTQYLLPTNRALLFPTRTERSQPVLVASSPRVVATPVAGRVLATPARVSTVPDSAVKATTAAAIMATKTTTSTIIETRPDTASAAFARPRSPRQHVSEEESALVQSPVLAMRAVPPPFASSGRFGAARPMLHEYSAAVDHDEMVPASSPLQARMRAPKAAGTTTTAAAMQREPSARPGIGILGDRRPSASNSSHQAVLFETPTKPRLVATTDGAAAVNTVTATPEPRPTAGGIQSLYQQMGWEDDFDDLG
ncbi:DNA replication regulator Sld3 [Niveomyces insectorum RCEF 264]|uniref:DNA replication regulator Sld3 n=1 Tax=Niveomyces insectorum RCEF 264 TaxID=1081102 RepID=A0A167U4N4_9HYPO|nr:DNA replication regulator Sld3 [Niveomyces insectorum RCEF 264]